MSSPRPQDSPPTTARGRQRRDALLDAAQQLFLEHGYGQVSVNDIVGRAGGSLSTLYRHFGNKEGLFQAMVERRSHHIYGTLTDEGVDELAIEAALQRLGIDLLVKVMGEETLGIYREVVAESPRQPQLARLFFDGGPGRVRLALADYFERRVQRQLMPACDTVELAGMFLGMLLGEWHLIRVLQLKSPPSRAAIEERVTRCVDLFLHGVQGLPSR
ncbi:TetR/AcrR family transcriptional regulator [Salinicola lusitanus]|uniref:TetR/AcrR family transcriptional regulator n=1 Tax=Salinicola lusitanus TaxID=1949085 RepID=A0ABZ3CUV9_9GAMM